MFAIAFDMDIKELRNSYGEPYNNAYYEIKILLRKYDFFNTQGSVYLTDKDDMANLFAAIYALKKIAWFKGSVHFEHKDRILFRISQTCESQTCEI